jgi:hypothetical protein
MLGLAGWAYWAEAGLGKLNGLGEISCIGRLRVVR